MLYQFFGLVVVYLVGESFGGDLEKIFSLQPLDIGKSLVFLTMAGLFCFIFGRFFTRSINPSWLEDVSGERVGRSQFLDGAIDAIRAQIAILDRDGKIIQVNARWRDFALDNACQVKGSGGGYGFPIISEVASKLETKVKSTASPSDKELSSIQKSVDDLINILELARESLSKSPS